MDPVSQKTLQTEFEEDDTHGGKTARITTLTTPKHQNMTAVGEKIHKR